MQFPMQFIFGPFSVNLGPFGTHLGCARCLRQGEEAGIRFPANDSAGLFFGDVLTVATFPSPPSSVPPRSPPFSEAPKDPKPVAKPPPTPTAAVPPTPPAPRPVPLVTPPAPAPAAAAPGLQEPCQGTGADSSCGDGRGLQYFPQSEASPKGPSVWPAPDCGQPEGLKCNRGRQPHSPPSRTSPMGLPPPPTSEPRPQSQAAQWPPPRYS